MFGIEIHGGQNPWTAKLIGDLKFRYVRVGIPWSEIQKSTLVFDWGATDDLVHRLRDAGCTILYGPGGTPLWLDSRLTPAEPGANFSADWFPTLTAPMLDYFKALQDRYHFELINLDCETNVPRWWRSLDPILFAETCLKPAADLFHLMGAEIVAPGTTLRGERNSTYHDSLSHFSRILESCLDKDGKTLHYIDHLSFHVYRDSGPQTIADIKRFVRDLNFDWTWFRSDKRRLWITETGFGSSVGDEAARLKAFQEYLPWFAKGDNDGEDWIENVFIYDGFGTGASLIKDDDNGNMALTPSGEYVAGLVAKQ